MEQTKIKRMPQRPLTTPRADQPKLSRIHKLRLRLLLGILVVILAFGGWQLHRVQTQIAQSQVQVDHAKSQLKSVEAKKQALKVQVDQLHNDDYLAKLVRQKYLVSKSGEVIFELPGTASKLTGNGN
ncbi:FtsB family cell division protein [Lacticaseibacillus sp. N501-2]|uniref:FtsB family cell division protein n=1 Tax=Lacticaseibacillus salsurae TaxID=3367729 RepID=UPI0038B23589